MREADPVPSPSYINVMGPSSLIAKQTRTMARPRSSRVTVNPLSFARPLLLREILEIVRKLPTRDGWKTRCPGSYLYVPPIAHQSDAVKPLTKVVRVMDSDQTTRTMNRERIDQTTCWFSRSKSCGRRKDGFVDVPEPSMKKIETIFTGHTGL